MYKLYIKILMEKNQLNSKISDIKHLLGLHKRQTYLLLKQLAILKMQYFLKFNKMKATLKVLKYSFILALIIVPIQWLLNNPTVIVIKGKDKKTEYVYKHDSTKTHDKFLTDLAHYESGNKYNPQPENPSYYGKYQIGRAALNAIGFSSIAKEEFIEDHELQELAMRRLMKLNKKLLISYIGRFEGKTVGGIYITQSGILAASHLGGSGNIIKFLESNGRDVFRDGNGTPITKYLNLFSDYNLHF